MISVIIATENLGKLQEIKSLLGDTFETFYSLKDFADKVPVEEESLSYVANALKKARKIGDRFGIPTLADDSGLEVQALQGRPGVFSSRYGKSDEERIERLLGELEGIPWEQREAVFKSYIVFYTPKQERCYVFYGELRGYIGLERHGKGGFGYDPIFYDSQRKQYLAEMGIEQKNGLSHRGKALLALKDFLNAEFFRSPKIQDL